MLDRYVVQDILPYLEATGGIVLLLESPHRREVCQQHPIFRESGLDVTNTLNEVL